MPRIFISHSSKDAEAARQISAWLSREGWADHFLDLDPQKGIKAGERWQQRLRESQNQCEAVLLLLSPAWANSNWCETEYLVANHLNKQIIGAIVEPVDMEDLPGTLTSEWQIVDLTSEGDGFSSDGLARLKDGMARLGIGSWYFDWPPDHDPQRQVFPGLRPFLEDDTGIFFGRDGEVLRALDQLRGLRREGSGTFIIQGASGAGKSSFLRAGLIRRLQREQDVGQVLPVMRFGGAGRGDYGNLTNVLAQAFAAVGTQKGAHEIKTKIAEKRLPDILKELSTLTPFHSLIFPVDQAEELLDVTRPEAELILNSLSTAVEDPHLDLVVLLTVRSDRWEELQTQHAFSTLKHTTFSLPPLPLGSYADVIRRPLQRLQEANRGIDFDEKLIDQLLSDIATGGATDGLPLLAFTLERLWHDFGDSGAITLENYEATGGISGAINAAVERALTLADKDRSIPLDRQAKIVLLRRGFIPWLAGIDVETGRPVRNIALASEIPQEARSIIELMADQRLLIRGVDEQSGKPTFEPTHEAVLRQWTLVGDWLGEQIQDFVAIDGIKRAARDWNANGRNATWISHHGTRLALAQQAASGVHGQRLISAETDYLVAATDAWAQRLAHQRRAQRLKVITGLAAVAVSFCAAVVLWLFWQDAKAAERKTFAALKIMESQTFSTQNQPERALAKALEGWRTDKSASTRSALLQSVIDIPESLAFSVPPVTEGPVALAWESEAVLLLGYRSGRVSRLDIATGERTDTYLQLAPAHPPKDGSRTTLIALSANQGGLAGLFGHGLLVSMDVAGQATDHDPTREYTVGVSSFEKVTFDRSKRIYVQKDQEASFLVTDCRSVPCFSQRFEGQSIDLSHEGARLALANDYEVRIFDVGTQPVRADFVLPHTSEAEIASLAWSKNASVIRVLDTAGTTFDIDVSDMSVTYNDGNSFLHQSDIRLFQGSESTSWFTCFVSSVCAAATDQTPAREIPTGFADDLIAPGWPAAVWTRSGNRLATLHPDGWVRIWSSVPADARLRVQPAARAIALQHKTQDVYVALRNEDIITMDKSGAARYLHRENAAIVRDHIDIAVNGSGEVIDLGLLRRNGATLDNAVARQINWIDKTRVVVTPSVEDSVLVFDAATGNELLRTSRLPDTPWSALAHPDGKHLIVSTTDGALRLIDLDTGQVMGTLVSAQDANSQPNSNALGAANISVSADSTQLVAGRADRHVVIYDVASGDVLWTKELPRSTANRVAFAPALNRLAVLAADGMLYVWTEDKSLWVSVDVKDSALVPTDFAWLDDDRIIIQSDSAGIKLIDLRSKAWLDRANTLLRTMVME